MSGKHQGLRYFQKFLNSKASERNALAKKVLRCVLAVGFVLSPWLGGEAYAEGIVPVTGSAVTFDDKNTAHIYAQQASGNVGLNRFTDFNVDKGQTANLYFKTEGTNPTVVNTLVNTVQNQISISGTVNGIKDGNVGGNLYFLSPAGMVIGSTGVINAGSLTVMTTGVDDITEPAAALSQIGYVYRPLGNSPITIQGKINTANGIDLRSLSIEISKNANGDIPCLKTGMVFNSVVNTDGLVDSVSLQYEGSASGNGELQLKRSDSTDTKINLVAYKYAEDTNGDLVKSFGNITLSGCDVDAIGAINITSGESLNITNNTNINTNNAINIELENTNNNNQYVGDFVFESGRIEAGGMPYITVGNDINIGNDATFVSTLVTNDTINFKTQKGNISNYGNIQMQSTLNMQAGQGASGGTPCLINGGTIESQGGGLSLTAMNNITNNGTIEANAQIKFAVGGTLTNQGTIESTSSNVQAHLGRNFKNIAVYNNESTENRTLIGGIIEAGGNVQVDYKIDNEGIGVASSEEPIDGIYNSGLIWAKGDKDPVKKPDGTVDANSGSGNIWLTSSYNITNEGTMMAARQITLNARDFLHNYGLIQGVTYLDIKSIMGYVYNHASGVIRATGGNIDLSTGQANLQIDTDLDGTKKELYRKFTPIIIEGSVEATSALNNTTNETNQGNINIRAYLGDIYINGGTIETKAGTSGEVESVAGDVILDAAQNITIGFQTEGARADDPTTQAGPNGENKDKYERDDEREYYKPKVDTSGKFVNGTAANISGTNITLTSGSGANTISMSAVNNTLTASDTITINTDSMNIVGGTFNAGTLNATGALELTGGTVTSNGNLTISGDKGLTIGNGAGISTGGNLTFASSEGAVINNHTWDNQNGSVTLSGKTGVTNNATITSSNGIGMTSAEGTIVNNAVLTAKGGAVFFEGKGDITNNALIEANGSVYIISTGGKVTNRAGIIAGKNFATASAASPFSLRARARAVDNGSVVISGSSGVINDTIDSIQANDSVLLESSAGDISNSSRITATNGSVEINGNGDVNNTGANISAGNNVSITAATGTLSNSSAITAANNVSITSTAGAVENSSAVTASGSVEISGSNVSNSGTVTTTGGSVTISGNGSVNNSANITATGGSVEISGNGGIENTANIEASKDVSMTASAGSINNSSDSTVAASGGSVSMSGGGNITGGTVTAGDGSVSMSGGGNVTGGTVTAGNGSVSMSGGGNVTGGNVTGNDVILAGGSGSNVTAASITVDNSLQLQGDNITATNVERGNDASGALNVGVSGAGGSNSTAQGDVNIKITSDVVFSNVNVSNANVETSGTIEVEKLHVEGKAGFVSSDTTVNIYGQGVTPDPNDTTAIQDKGDGNSGWLTLKIDDTGVQSTFVGEENKTDYPVQMSGKLVDYDPYDTYMEHYGDVADIFGRTDLIVADLIVANASYNGGTTQDGVVVLKQDDDGLRIEEEKKE